MSFLDELEELCLELDALESYKCDSKGLTVHEKGTLVKKKDVRKLLLNFLKWHKPSDIPDYAGEIIVKMEDGADAIAYYLNSPYIDEFSGRHKCYFYSRNSARDCYRIPKIKSWRRFE